MILDECMNGFVTINDCDLPFNFNNGMLTISVYGIKKNTPKGRHDCGSSIIGYLYDSNHTKVLFHSGNSIVYELREDIKKQNLYCSWSYSIDFYVKDYSSDDTYMNMVFECDEINYILTEGNGFWGKNFKPNFNVNSTPECVLDYSLNINEIDVKFTFENLWVPKVSEIEKSAVTKRRLRLTFAETVDYSFICKLYIAVYNLFSFMINRTNISFNFSELWSFKEGNPFPDISAFVPLMIGTRVPEDSPELLKHIITVYKPHLKELTEFISDNKVDVLSLHESVYDQRYFGIKRCIAIPAAFEYYCRSFVPSVLSKQTRETIDEIEKYIDECIKKYSGKKKNTAKRIKYKVNEACDPSTSDKLQKIFSGFNHGDESWKSLKDIFKELETEQVKDYADTANKWRNDVAHDKREFVFSHEACEAMRFVEYLNYCIVLRHVGYEDNEIKSIIDKLRLLQNRSQHS
jgi:hypothetical protein